MSVDPSILATLEQALTSSPDNVALRLHLIPLLLESGRAADALDHCTAILAGQPDSLEGLRLAAQSAEATGDRLRADGYRRLYEALSGASARSMVESAFEGVEPDFQSAPVQDSEADDPEREAERLLASETSEATTDWDIEKPEITLADVAGMEEVKRRLNIAFLAPMKNPDMRKLYGKSLRGGLMLYGPPGCGKTFIARATAGELGARFLSVGLADVLDMYIGQSERNLHEIFETARRNRPCVLFFDEVDALGRKRSQMRENNAGRGVVNQLLSEMDSVDANNEGIFILAATNHPWDVDTALRRPGRLDRTLLVLPPDAPAREAILRLNMRGRPVEGLDYRWLAGQTDNFSGADVAHLCDSAAELALEESLERGTARPIQKRDFQQALKEVRPSVRPWLDTARHYAQYANEGGSYDELLKYLRSRNML